MSDANKAVFLSYASQDAEAARRICEALRAAGVEVWFDQSELRGGDAWDAKIRKQIKECALFVPVISANTQARTEGYFRLEWRLADQRTHLMAKGRPFLVPVTIDATRDSEAHVPDSFLEVQWTRLTTDEAVDAFGKRIMHLLEGGREVSAPIAARTREIPRGRSRSVFRPWIGAAVALVLGAIAFGLWKWLPTTEGSPRSLAGTASQSPARRATEIVEDEEHYNRTALELAEQFCQQAIARDPNGAEAHAAYARVHAALIFMSFDPTAERRVAAQKEMNLAARLAPEADEVLLARADFFKLSATTWVESEPILRTLVARRPQHKYTLRQLALTLRARARALGDNSPAAAALYDEAVGLLRRADALPGGDAMALLLLAQHEASQGRGDEAERVLDEGLARQVSPRLLRFKSDLLVARGDLAEASATVEKLPASNVVEPGFATALVQIRVWQRRPEEALRLLAACPVDYFEDTFFTGPKDYWTGLALSLQPSRQDAARVAWQQALRTVENRLAKQPGAAQLVRWKGVLLSYAGDPAEARRLLELAEQLQDPLLGINNVRLSATAWLRLGERERALQSIRAWRAARVSPSTMGWLRFDPGLDALRGSAEFREALAAIEQRTGFVAHAAAGAGDATVEAKSVAVLAFRQQSADPENEYLCEAMSDELCNVLGRVPGLRVAASASAFSFKGQSVRLSEIARQLGVTYLVNGRVMKVGSQVRVRVELIHAADESIVWNSDWLTKELKNMFAVQDEIVPEIAKSLAVQLGGARGLVQAVNPEAYRLYYEGREAWKRRTSPAEGERARSLFQQAIALDPRLGRAYAGLVDVALFDAGQTDQSTYTDRNSAKVAETAALADKAVQLEPDSAEAHSAKGRVFWHAWRPADAEQEYRKAMELNPNYSDAHLMLARLLHAEGRMDEALAEVRRAAELDPLTSRSFDNSSLLLRDAGRSAEALSAADRALAIQPDSIEASYVRMMALSDLERHEETAGLARTLVRQQASIAARRTGSATRGLVRVIYVLVRAKMTAEARELFSTIPWTDQSLPLALAAVGETEKAIEALDPKAASLLAVTAFFYRAEWDPARKDPRFVRFLQQVGWKDAHDRAQAWRAAHPPEKPMTNK